VEYDIWVYPDASLGEAVDSHLVPTYLYVDAEGSVQQKLVGMKDKKAVSQFVASYVE
jgi:hypothetical protein